MILKLSKYFLNFTFENFSTFSTVIEVASGEYGHEFLDRMVELIDNGRIIDWKPSVKILDRYEKIYSHQVSTSSNTSSNKANRKCSSENTECSQFEEEINPNNLKFKCSSWQQFVVLFRRASKQIYNNKVGCFTFIFNNVRLKIFLLLYRIISCFEFPCTFFWVSYLSLLSCLPLI